MNFKFVALAAMAAMSIGSANAMPVTTTDWGVVNTADGKSSNYKAPAGTSYDHYFSFELDGSYFLLETAVANNNTKSVFDHNFASLEKLVEGEWEYIANFSFTNLSTTKEYGLQGAGKYRTEVTGMSTGTNTAYGTVQVLIDPPNKPFDVTPVPEPETYALLLAGLSVVGFVAGRRKSV